MRRALTVLLAGGMAIASTGCDEFLTPKPTTFINSNNFYTKPADFEAAVAAVYSNARGLFGGNWRLLNDLRGDVATLQFNINVPGFTFQIDEFTEATNDGTVTGQYNSIFNTIFVANVVTSRIETVEFPDQAQKARLLAEAKFGRALAYWQALAFFGLGESWQPNNLAVPLILEEITTPAAAFNLERATVLEVYNQIIQDLTEAKAVLPLRGTSGATGGNAGRYTKGAATFLLGATYQLNPAAQGEALAQFADLEAQGYALVTSGTASSGNNAYRQVFNPSAKNNIESIFENQFNVAIESGGLRQDLVGGMSPLNSQGSGSNTVANFNRIVPYGANGGGGYMPTQNLILSFAGADPSKPETPFDLRYAGGYGAFCPGSGTSGVLNNTADVLRTGGDITLRSPNTSYPELNIASVRDPVNKTTRTNCIGYWTKWRWAETQHMPQSGRDNNNWIVFRYADALLRRAESLTRLNRPTEALVFVNRVRARAGLPPLTGLSGDALLDAILQERAWELAGEGHRWMDLKRFGRATTVIAAHGIERKARVPRSSALSYDLGPGNYRLRYPIRPRDVDLSQCRIKQNPGWGSCEGS